MQQPRLSGAKESHSSRGGRDQSQRVLMVGVFSKIVIKRDRDEAGCQWRLTQLAARIATHDALISRRSVPRIKVQRLHGRARASGTTPSSNGCVRLRIAADVTSTNIGTSTISSTTGTSTIIGTPSVRYGSAPSRPLNHLMTGAIGLCSRLHRMSGMAR